MATIIEALDEKFVKALMEQCKSIFLHGYCYVFAIALHRETGWPIVGLMEIDGYDLKAIHVAVRRPDNLFLDARGTFPEEEFGLPFSKQPPYDLQEISEEDLHAACRTLGTTIHEASIENASFIAGALWPDLPWQKGSLQSRIKAFTDALEVLSRNHGFFIRSALPECLPIIEPLFGDEAGYALKPTADGLRVAINRRLGKN